MPGEQRKLSPTRHSTSQLSHPCWDAKSKAEVKKKKHFNRVQINPKISLMWNIILQKWRKGSGVYFFSQVVIKSDDWWGRILHQIQPIFLVVVNSDLLTDITWRIMCRLSVTLAKQSMRPRRKEEDFAHQSVCRPDTSSRTVRCNGLESRLEDRSQGWSFDQILFSFFPFFFFTPSVLDLKKRKQKKKNSLLSF